ncbi:unnamed protein product [Prorocentrum cordatum]|uniref:Glycosyltransferase family 25 (LPS biosynthesis protein) n=1 Tax=Prorocentrum cordatum TaxID=2364126 RepID=A0ABN9STL0_9DINO|nr:unnamed protein product [Polarella glacialis]
MIDFEELEQAEAWPPVSWAQLRATVEVTALALPDRACHARGLLRKWGFEGAEVFLGLWKEDVELDEWVRAGRITESRSVTSGRVACHFGHRAILEDFLRGPEPRRPWLLVFEDDLLDAPAEPLQAALLGFLAEVPATWDVLHLGYLWESREDREHVSGRVFRSHSAVGRHAYMVTRHAARALLEATWPQSDAGDEMYLRAIRERGLSAYQPLEPLFRQDRDRFPSRILLHRRPARDFRPSPRELAGWQAEAAASRRARSPSDGRRLFEEFAGEPVTQLRAEQLAAQWDDRRANPDIELGGPLLLVAAPSGWSPEVASGERSLRMAARPVRSVVGAWALEDGQGLGPSLQISRAEGRGLCAAVRRGSAELLADLAPAGPPGQLEGALRDHGGARRGVLRVRAGDGPEWMLVSHSAAGEARSNAEWSRARRAEDCGDGEEEVEHSLSVRLQPGGTEVHFLGGRPPRRWRLLPPDGSRGARLRRGPQDAAAAAAFADSDELLPRRQNFRILEPAGGAFVVRVRLAPRRRLVWYEPAAEGPPAEAGEEEAPLLPSHCPAPEVLPGPGAALDQILPLRLVGPWARWSTSAPGLEFQPQPFRPLETGGNTGCASACWETGWCSR